MPTNTGPSAPTLQDQLVDESCSMVRHLVGKGMRAPAALVQAAAGYESARNVGQPIDLAALATIHERLAKLVAPASPSTLYLLDRSHQAPSRLGSLGPVSVVRQLVLFSMGCVLAFIVFSIYHLIVVSPGGGEAQMSQVAHAFVENVYWLAAAGVGASFAVLFQINETISKGTFDPDDAPAYWIKVFLGVVAGFILVAMVPTEGIDSADAQVLAKPTIALLGGFSAQAVYRILNRLVETLEDLFSGGQKEQAAIREQAVAARAQEDAVQARLVVAGKLVQLQEQIAAGADVKQQVQDLIRSLVPESGAQDTPAPAPASPAVAPAEPDVPEVPADAIIATGVPVAPVVIVSGSADEAPPQDASTAQVEAAKG
ncbi:hypothetical protein [Longimicrobium sp.]|jgi:hypothetical protein|uniref:hypothetical protein n=1 Tax=Longimicrobium sp. TaxID=2029185 RepID=UPI002EDAF590